MKAVIFGAGNIGRGFIAPLFSGAGYEVTFIDVSQVLIEAVNKTHEYTLRIVSNDGEREVTINNVYAVDGNDADAAARAIADADITATCVGAKAIKFILPNFIRGLRLRLAESGRPLDLLICENLMNADEYVRSMLEGELTPDELASVGLVETSVGRMVPAPDKDKLAADPLFIAVEEYGVLPVDRDAFRGEPPAVKQIVPFSPFKYYIERKLYLHNMGHAVCAYLGDYMGYEKICTSIADTAVRVIVTEAMTESVLALAKRYNLDPAPIMNHAADLIRRFGNRALGDTCARVGADIPRKLAPSDRLTGAALSVIEAGASPVYIALGAAAALFTYTASLDGEGETALPRAMEHYTSLSGVSDGVLFDYVSRFYSLFLAGESLEGIIAAADVLKHEAAGMIV